MMMTLAHNDRIIEVLLQEAGVRAGSCLCSRVRVWESSVGGYCDATVVLGAVTIID
jgi:hypothetical protein